MVVRPETIMHVQPALKHFIHGLREFDLCQNDKRLHKERKLAVPFGNGLIIRAYHQNTACACHNTAVGTLLLGHGHDLRG